MGDLRVSIHLGDTLVEDRVLRVHHSVRIGEALGAAVPFPGADMTVARVGRQLAVRGRQLAEGQRIGVSLGPVRVDLEHTVPGSLYRNAWAHVDSRFLVVALGVTLSGLWVDTAHTVLRARSHHGVIARGVAIAHQITGLSSPVQSASDNLWRSASVPPGGERGAAEPDSSPAGARDGPLAVSDDRRSGIAFYAWYRQVVTTGSEAGSTLLERLERNPDDRSARAALAAFAYETERFELAAEHYAHLNADADAARDHLLQEARAWRRLGRHEREITLYRRLLARDDGDSLARAGLASAFARLGRFDEAHRQLTLARSTTTGSPLDVQMLAAVVYAAEGDEDRSFATMERVVAHRSRMDPSLRVELRRNIALDPVFASLRQDVRFRAMLAREYGAAAPRPLR